MRRKKELPLAAKPIPGHLPFGFKPVKWDDWGCSLICRTHGHLVKFWPVSRVVIRVPG
jgi:hypothetical protein